MLTFQQIILKLQEYWDAQGCALLQPYDMEVGAGTSHTATFLRAIGPEPWRAAYVQPSRRPKDGRDCKPVLGEITYGIERLAMYLQGVENVYDLVWTEWQENGVQKHLTYGDVFHQNEVEQSTYNFEHANTEFLFSLFTNYEAEAK